MQSVEQDLHCRLRNVKSLSAKLSFLGYIISNEGLEPDPENVEVIKKFQTPKTQKEVKSFIGALSYYRQFIPDFSSVARPSLKLTRKSNEFSWGQEQQVAFDLLNQCLETAPVLKLFMQKTMLKTDASAYGVGAILEQEYEDGWRVVAYASRMLNKYQKNYQIPEEERSAVIFACKSFIITWLVENF